MRKGLRRFSLFFVFGFLLTQPFILHAESEGVLNQLLAPGPLMGGHKELEKVDCFKCHDAGKGLPESKCLSCHKDIKSYVDLKRGFHGLTAKSCTACHSDHKGRDYDSVAVAEKDFDHLKMTGFALEGKHSEIKCMECHREKRTKKYLRPKDTRYFGATTTCVSCHKKDDIHFFVGKPAKQDCNQCHSSSSWKKDIKFDHNKDTRFKLEEKHAELKCQECHLVVKSKKIYQYQWPKLNKSQCLSCHKDFHHKNLSPKYRGGDCLKCHNQSKWTIPAFDHKATGFALKGKHAPLKCMECHKQTSKAVISHPDDLKNYKWTGLKGACLSCHKDVHKFGKFRSEKMGNPNQCLKCHDESSWTKIHDFNHDTNTRYPLDGKHVELKCSECHLPKDRKNPTRMPNSSQGVYHWSKLANKNCENCHKNPHIGQFKPAVLAKGCVSCHTTQGWNVMKSDTGFDHSKTRFQLTGAHLTTSCNECHLVKGKKVYKFKSVEQKFCVDCHSNVHQKQFSPKFSAQACMQCHTTKSFSERLPFDHAQTSYKLEGGHTEVKCQECHKPSTTAFRLSPPNISKKEMASGRSHLMSRFQIPDVKTKQCATCHADYHRGQLGQSCQNCHTVQSWKKTTFDHDLESRFPLNDKHASLDCKKCHIPIRGVTTVYHNEKLPLIRYKPLGQNCVDCHKDPHRGEFGKRCNDCHTARGWNVTKDFHKNFLLKGVHYSLECAECHKEGRKLSGLSQDCMFCHQKDDIHHGTLPNCKECHTQSFWENTGFRHSLTRFPLRGVHRTLECGECHYQGGAQTIYQGLDSRCESCHIKDALNATTFDHAAGGNLTNCNECHKNFFTFQRH